MRIAIVGGSGTLGRAVTEELRARGHDVRVLSRHAPQFRVDLATGEGLGVALAGCDVVVDASNDSSKQAEVTLVEGTKRLIRTEADAGVKHHVCISIVGCDRIPIRYFRVKTAQERAVEKGVVPWTIVRATQFHELVSNDLRELGKRWRASAGKRVVFLPVPLPGAIGKALCGGALTTDSPDIRGATSFKTWLEVQAGAS